MRNLTTTQKMNVVTSFINKYKISDEDLCQELYCTALLAKSNISCKDLYLMIFDTYVDWIEHQKMEVETPSGLMRDASRQRHATKETNAYIQSRMSSCDFMDDIDAIVAFFIM